MVQRREWSLRLGGDQGGCMKEVFELGHEGWGKVRQAELVGGSFQVEEQAGTKTQRWESTNSIQRVANVSWYLHKGILSSSKHSPDDYGPHLAPVYWWDCKTGQYQAFCFTVIVVATVHVAEYTTIDIAVQCFLSSPLPSDSSSTRAGDSYWAGKGFSQARKLFVPLEPIALITTPQA